MRTMEVILAAGLGTRMKSTIPKVLHKVAGKPMVSHVLTAVGQAAVQDTKDIIVVLGFAGEKVEQELGADYRYVFQNEQRGTGHALLQALPLLEEYTEGICLVLCGDTPLLTGGTLERLKAHHLQSKAKATILTTNVPDPTGYGRVVSGPRGIQRIVEEKDASPEEKRITEINTGAYCFDIAVLKEGLTRLTPANAQGEYYLTDVIKFLVADNERVETFLLADYREAMGINNRVQLAEAEAYLRAKILKRHMLQGVTVVDPLNTYVEEDVRRMDTISIRG